MKQIQMLKDAVKGLVIGTAIYLNLKKKKDKGENRWAEYQ